jgi:hypothetical protein
MKEEQVKEALYSAFTDYWKVNDSIIIDGHACKKTQLLKLLFIEDNCISLLMQAIGFQAELPNLQGKLEAYIQAATPNDSKSIKLSFTIRNEDYTATYNRDDDVVNINIQDVRFQKIII